MNRGLRSSLQSFGPASDSAMLSMEGVALVCVDGVILDVGVETCDFA